MAEAEPELAELNDSSPAMAALDARLSAIIAGDRRPRDGADRLELAQRAYDKALYATAARLWAEALAADPRLGDDRRAQPRYNAACAAALAGSGRGKDEPPPDAASMARLREQALDWLRADLAAWSRVVAGGPSPDRQSVPETLGHWKTDPDLAGIRDEAAQGSLTAGEKESCGVLWSEVEAVLAKARSISAP